MLNRVQKVESVNSISENLEKSKAVFLVNFKGLNVEQITDLRKKLNPVQTKIKVVRNTLARRALKNHSEMESAFQDEFKGPNAFVFSYEDPSASAKALSDFSKDIEFFELKVGFMEGQKLDKAKIHELATLPSKDELKAKLLNVMLAPASQMVRVLSAVPGSLVNVLNAYKDSKE